MIGYRYNWNDGNNVNGFFINDSFPGNWVFYK